MNTLYLQVPPRHTANWREVELRFALCRDETVLIRTGQAVWSELAGMTSKANIVLLIAAVDVTLLELTVPPMPAAKLRQALPNLVEDQLMSDSSESVLVALPALVSGSSRRVVAATQRSWLQTLSESLFAVGANHIRAVPAQLCLPWESGVCSALIEDNTKDVSLTIRSAQDHGIGLLQPLAQTPHDHLETLLMLVPDVPVELQVAAQSLNSYQAAIAARPEWAQRVHANAIDWSVWIQSCRAAGLDLMAGLNQAQIQRIQWQLWRWPLVLAMLVLIVNVGALNYDYWSLKREVQSLKQGMVQTYRSSFPKDTDVAYPLEQMQKNLNLAERVAGRASNDDFTMLLSKFGTVWNSALAAPLPKLVSIEYKDHGLLIQIRGEMPQKQLQQALEAKDLVLKKNSAEIWQVRNAQ